VSVRFESERLSDCLDPHSQRRLIIAEVAQTHDGSLGQAHAFIDAVATTGADAIKFQTHIAEAESTPDEPFRVKFSRQDKTRFEYWQRTSFTPEQWAGLAEHAREKGLIFLSSAFSAEAVALLESLDMVAWKVGSGEVSNLPLLECMAATGKPILLSSGLSTLEELDRVVAQVRAWQVGTKASLGLFQTTSMYPTPPEKLGLNLIPEYIQRFGCPVGLSDHSGTIYPGLAATTLGARLLEVHVTLSPFMFGPDVSSSLTVEGLKQLVEGVRFLEKSLASPVDKGQMAEDLAEMRRIFQKSVVAKIGLEAGTVLQEEHLTVKKPGTGIPAADLKLLLGRQLRNAVQLDQPLCWDDLLSEVSS
jgi:N,N'-diacetyllegionaminate synthase